MEKSFFERFDCRIRRNRYGIKLVHSISNAVNIEHYPLLNVGDTLGPIIVEWMLQKKGIMINNKVKDTKHLMTVGSILSMGLFDATVWGSGILNNNVLPIIRKKKKIYNRKLDVRAVRGPLTRDVMLKAGYTCPKVFGDPAILLPLIYEPLSTEKKYEVSLILHYRTKIHNSGEHNKGKYTIEIDDDTILKNNIKIIDPKTDDYKSFVNDVVTSKLVISSSLHGIILAEAYGIPAVFLNFGMDDQPTKFEDWYLSTGRSLFFCTYLDDALKAKPPVLPDFKTMRKDLIDSFPYDLWEK